MATSQQFEELRDALKESVEEGAGEIQEAQEDGAEELEADGVEEEAESEEDEALEYLNELPGAIGIDAADFYALKLKLDDENAEPIPFGEIKDRLQAANRATHQIEQERAQLAEQAQALQAQAQAAMQQQGQMSQETMEAIGSIKAIEDAYPALEQNWAEREAKEPGQVALERQRIGQRYAEAKGRYQQVVNNQQQQQQVGRQQWLGQQEQMLQQAIPEWANPETKQALQRDITQFALEHYNVSPQELANVDARTVLLMRDAMLGQAAKDGGKKALKAARKAPKVLPKGVRIKGRKVSDARVQALQQRAIETGRSSDKLAAAKAILKG